MALLTRREKCPFIEAAERAELKRERPNGCSFFHAFFLPDGAEERIMDKE